MENVVKGKPINYNILFAFVISSNSLNRYNALGRNRNDRILVQLRDRLNRLHLLCINSCLETDWHCLPRG